jgi:bifunctional oligoribonuclease and PAP phosphatase NrnA
LDNKHGKIKELLADKNLPIVIVTHTNPDGDAVGSSLGLFEYFRLAGHQNIQVITPNAYPLFLQWMPNNEKVLHAVGNSKLAKNLIMKAGVLFCLDFNSLDRTELLEKPIRETNAIKVMIDHHPDPAKDFDFLFSDVNVSSTAELVYEFIVLLGAEKLLNRQAAECLFAGIMTDTGSFSYGNNNPRTYEIASRLVSLGVDAANINRMVYNTYSENRLRLLGYCLGQKLKVLQEYRTAYISLSADDLKRFNHQEGDTEGIVNYALSIIGIELAAIFIERQNHVKISFRSIGHVDVNRLAREHFQGGGHKNAAGGKCFDTMKNTLTKFEALLKAQANL